MYWDLATERFLLLLGFGLEKSFSKSAFNKLYLLRSSSFPGFAVVYFHKLLLSILVIYVKIFSFSSCTHLSWAQSYATDLFKFDLLLLGPTSTLRSFTQLQKSSLVVEQLPKILSFF